MPPKKCAVSNRFFSGGISVGNTGVLIASGALVPSASSIDTKRVTVSADDKHNRARIYLLSIIVIVMCDVQYEFYHTPPTNAFVRPCPVRC